MVSEVEASFPTLRTTVKARGYLLKHELAELAEWKSPRIRPHIQKNTDGFVQEISRIALTTTEEQTRIEVLTLLRGVGWPTASVVLHLLHDDPYPILDFRALFSVDMQPESGYNFSFWSEYTQYTRVLARQAGVDMRTLDRALWQYSKDEQKPKGTV